MGMTQSSQSVGEVGEDNEVARTLRADGGPSALNSAEPTESHVCSASSYTFGSSCKNAAHDAHPIILDSPTLIHLALTTTASDPLRFSFLCKESLIR